MPNRTPTLLATSPQAAAQSTDVGRELHRLTVWNNRVYAAYGDYGVNTGPIDVISLDPTDLETGFVSEATLNTEETWLFRHGLDGRLVVAFIDPRGYGDGSMGQFAYANTPGDWTVIDNVTPVPIHAMGVCETVDGIFLFGAANEPDPPNGGATIWRSTDNGVTWTVSLAPRPDVTNYARFYTPMLYGDVIEVLLDSSAGRLLYHWDGSSWSVVPNQLPGRPISDAVPFTYQGTAFHFCVERGKPESYVQDSPWHIRTLASADARRSAIAASIPVSKIRDASTDGVYLYLLDEQGSVWRGDETGVWERKFTLVVAGTSLAVADGVCYLGTADSKVYSTAV